MVRFLNHAAEQRGLTQAAIAARVEDASISTVSRWFRGQASLTDDDLEALALAVEVPAPTLMALATFERAGHRRNMLASMAAWYYLAEAPGDVLVTAGFTMAPAAVILRGHDLSGVELLASILDPLARGPAPSIMAAAEPTMGPAGAGTLHAPWLATTTILRHLAIAHATRARIWGRATPTLGLDAAPDCVQVLANQWVAVASRDPRSDGPPELIFWDSPRWQAVVAPLLAILRGDADAHGHALIWDASWPPDDPRQARLRARLDAAHAALHPDRLMT